MTHDLLNPDDSEVIRFKDPTDVLPPGIFSEVNLYARVQYSGPEDNPRIHLQVVPRPEGVSWLTMTPLAVALMLAVARESGQGIERGLELLVQEAMSRAGSMFKAMDEDEGGIDDRST